MKEEFEGDELTFEFELLNSDDHRTITLVCTSDIEMTPDEYSQALIAFAERMQVLGEFSEADFNTLN